MNKKDLNTLIENYQNIFENSTLPSLELDNSELEVPQVDAMLNINNQQNPSIETEPVNHDSFGHDENIKMTMANLKSLIAHGQKILQAAESGQEIEAWMTDKITVASNDILDVSNAIEFRN